MALLWTIVGALVAGVIIGPLARLLVPGKQDISVLATILLGAVGALIGGVIAQWLGVGDTSGIDWIKFAIQVVVAAVVVALYVTWAGGATSRTR